MNLQEAVARIKGDNRLSDFVRSDLSQVKRTSKGITGCCPFHSESSPSFHVDDRRGRYKCFGCGVGGDIFQYLEDKRGMSIVEAVKHFGYDLDMSKITPEEIKQIKEETQIREDKNGWYPEEEKRVEFNPNKILCLETESYDEKGVSDYYTYVDVDNIPCYYVVRKVYSSPKGTKKINLPVSLYTKDDRTEWAYGMGCVRRLFNLHSLVTENKPVLIVEGEKCAKMAGAMLPNWTVTTWTGGASNVQNIDWSLLRDKKCYIWPDNDEPGKKAASYIYDYLSNCKVLTIPDKPKGWDIADALEEGWDKKKIEAFIHKSDEVHDIFPLELCEGYGYLGLLADYIKDISPIPHPLLAMGAAIAVLATLNAQKVITEEGLHPNIYIVTLASSGKGKSFPYEAIAKIFNMIGIPKTVMGNPASASGLIGGLHKRRGRALMAIDEFGRAFGEWTDAKSASFKHGIITKLLSLFTQSRTAYQGDEYSTRNEDTPAVYINKPNLSMYGTTVPDSFYKNISTDDSSNGFVARMLVLDGIDPNTKYNALAMKKQMPQELFAYLKELSAPPLDTLNNSTGIYDFEPIVVPFSDKARTVMHAFRDEMLEMASLSEVDDSFKSSIALRAYENASKIALIGRESNKEIGERVAIRATRFVRTSVLRFYNSAKDNIYSNPWDKSIKEIEIYLRRKRCWITKKDLSNRFRMPAKKFTAMIDQLLESEFVEKQEKPVAGSQRDTTYFRYVKK